MKKRNPSIPQHLNRHSGWPPALTIAASVAILVSGIMSVQATTTDPITFTISTQINPPLGTSPYISPELIGQSGEVYDMMTSGTYNGTNSQMINLFTNVNFTIIRAGGNSADNSGEDITTPTDSQIDNFFSLVKACNMGVILQLNLKTGDSNDDATVASYVYDNYANNMWDVGIGNEPNLYPTSNQWGITGFPTYKTVWQSFARQVHSAAPAAVLGGPDASSSGSSWCANLANYENYRKTQVDFQDIHYHYCPVGHLQNGESFQADLADMLNRQNILNDYNGLIGNMEAAPWNNYQTNEFTEFNAHNSDGNVGPNNKCDTSFGSALFLLDALHWWGQYGLNSLDVYGGLGSAPPNNGFHNLFYYDASGTVQAYPQLYACKAMDISGYTARAYNSIPLNVDRTSDPDGLDVMAYCISNKVDGYEYVTVINKENGSGARNASVTIDGRASYLNGARWIIYLTQAQGNLEGTTNVTLGTGPNNVLTGTNVWNGQWTRYTSGLSGIIVTNGTAAIVRIE